MKPAIYDVESIKDKDQIKVHSLGDAMLLVRHNNVLESTPMGSIASNSPAVGGWVFVFRLKMKTLYFPQNNIF